MASPSHQHNMGEQKVLKEELPDQPIIIDMPKDLEPDLNNTCWIHRVPEKLRKVNEAAYTPQLVSIGPLHHGHPKLKAMEHKKFKYEQQFWNRDLWKHIEEGKRIEFMDKLLPRIQSSYAVTFDFDPAHAANNRLDFMRMIFRDACFIFELFLRNYETLLPAETRTHSNDYILRTPWLRNGIQLDLIMLENQLPYFVFEELFDFVYPEDEHGTERKNNHYLAGVAGENKRSDFFKNITCEFFIDYYKFGKPRAEETYKEMTQSANKIRFADLVKDLKDGEIKIPFKKIKHFTDLVRMFMLTGDLLFPEKDDAIFCLCTATQLDRAGVKFVRCKENKVLADINQITEPYRNYLKLKVPELKVQGNTDCIMRNVMALEQFVYPDEPFICNYIFLLDQLISTAEDVEFLIDKKIVNNWLSSNDAVVDLVNKLCDQIVVSRYFYTDLCQRLNEHYDNPWNFFKATLNRVYFKDLFTISSTIIGIVFLVFSLFSTYSTIKTLLLSFI